MSKVKPRTSIHLVGGQHLRTALPLEQALAAFGASGANGWAIEIVKDHGAVRRAVIPAGAVVWLEDVS